MKLVTAKCPNCCADINIDENSKIIKCEYCNASIIVEDNNLKLQEDVIKENNVDIYKENLKSIQSRKSKKLKLYLLLFALILVIAYVISIIISWNYKNSLGSVILFISGLCYLTFVKQSGLREKAFLFADIFGFVFYICALCISIYIYNCVPGYINEWESDNIKLVIDRENATIEFKDKGTKETFTYSVNLVNGRNLIKISDYDFIYSEENDVGKMCLANKDECVEELKLVKYKVYR